MEHCTTHSSTAHTTNKTTKTTKKQKKKRTIPLNTCWQLLNEIFYKMSHKKVKKCLFKTPLTSSFGQIIVPACSMHTDYYEYVEKLTIYNKTKRCNIYLNMWCVFVLSGYQRKRFSTSCLDRCFPSVRVCGDVTYIESSFGFIVMSMHTVRGCAVAVILLYSDADKNSVDLLTVNGGPREFAIKIVSITRWIEVDRPITERLFYLCYRNPNHKVTEREEQTRRAATTVAIHLLSIRATKNKWKCPCISRPIYSKINVQQNEVKDLTSIVWKRFDQMKS